MQKAISSILLSLVVFSLGGVSHAAAPDCSRPAGSLPDPTRPAGVADSTNPVQHIVVIMQENHSFDNYFGRLNDSRFYGKDVDGAQPQLFNLNSRGEKVPVHAETSLCTPDPGHNWNAVHSDYNNGKLDGFVTTNEKADGGVHVMGTYDYTDLPFYYGLATQFAIGDRYFCSTLTQTFPNRFYLMTGTSFGHIKNDFPFSTSSFAQKTIFDVLTQYGVSWKYYTDSVGYLKLFQPMYLRNLDKMKKIKDYEADLAANTLPQVVFLDASFEGEDEHPAADIQVGQAWTAHQIQSLLGSQAWRQSALFLTYDENGGFFDHVAPPEACAPDAIAPMTSSSSLPGGFDRYGFRVPFVAVSPFAKHHFVSHQTYDHTSILKYIETKFNLPALTARDANADGFSDVFDYAHPIYDVTPLPSGERDPNRSCGRTAAFSLPVAPVSMQSKKTGLCLEATGCALTGQGAPLQFGACVGSDNQKFSIKSDRFATYQIQNVESSLCAAVDWSTNQVLQAPCAADEDQGFEIEADPDGSVAISGWHGDFCFTGASSGAHLAVSACSDDGSSSFLLSNF